MRDGAHLSVINGPDQLPQYPEELADPKLSSDYFTMFWHDRWLNSTMCLKADLEVQGAALNLFFIARKQTPVGSLPDDHALLAKLLRIDLGHWEALMRRPITPLHNWSRYLLGNGVVLGHPVVIEVARDALHKRETRELANEEKAVTTRRTRLREKMREMGFDKAVLADKGLVERIDAWLIEHHPGQRRSPQIERSIARAIEVGQKEGWLKIT